MRKEKKKKKRRVTNMAKKEEFVKEIADIDEDFAKWYTDIVIKTELAD